MEVNIIWKTDGQIIKQKILIIPVLKNYNTTQEKYGKMNVYFSIK